jgi:hypothetical protein
MERNLLERIQEEINYILEHEDGLSHHDKVELHRLLNEKKKHEKALGKLEADLQKIIDDKIDA